MEARAAQGRRVFCRPLEQRGYTNLQSLTLTLSHSKTSKFSLGFPTVPDMPIECPILKSLRIYNSLYPYITFTSASCLNPMLGVRARSVDLKRLWKNLAFGILRQEAHSICRVLHSFFPEEECTRAILPLPALKSGAALRALQRWG